MWGWVLLLISAAFAAPNSVTEDENDRSPARAVFYALRWLNPLNWLFYSSRSNPVGVAASVLEPTTFLDPVALAEFYGYAAENHSVTTEDGYILGVHRLPSGRRKNEEDVKKDEKPRKVVVVHHAFLTSSREFLILGPQKSLAFILSDAGYDVWLTNVRGNTYSRKHVSISPKDPKFWDFSYHEHGYYDLPAVIDYALKVSGQSKLHYIGYSIGTVAFFVMSSERPEMSNKVISFSGMGPLMTTEKARSRFLQFIMTIAPVTMGFLRRLRIYELLPHYNFFTTAGQTLCTNGRLTQSICMGFLNALSGTSALIQPSIFPEMLTHQPSGTSIKTLLHFAQNGKTSLFQKYDLGPEENMKRYNSTTPSSYNVSAVSVPTQIFYAMNDLMADYTEALKLRELIPTIFNFQKVEDDRFTHLDFIWAHNVNEIVYAHVLKGIRQLDDCSVQNAEFCTKK